MLVSAIPRTPGQWTLISRTGAAPNASAHLLPEAGATQERTLEAVRCSALFGAVHGQRDGAFSSLDHLSRLSTPAVAVARGSLSTPLIAPESGEAGASPAGTPVRPAQ